MAASRTEQYFLSLFDVSSVSMAAEHAADSLRANVGAPTKLPVDVFQLAQVRGLRIRQDLSKNGRTEGMLIPCKNGYLVRLRSDVAGVRKRFSLAHELGHTFFYKDEGTGPRHAIGILDRTEHAAEERICDHFAGFLLMPSHELRRHLGMIKEGRPSELLQRLGYAAQCFLVSKEALIRHANALSLDVPPYLLICSSFRSNPRVPGDRDLRTDWFAVIGAWKDQVRLWKHHRLSAIGLKSACELYSRWDEANKGALEFDVDGKFHKDLQAPRLHREDVTVAINRSGKWKATTQSYVSASQLYAWDDVEGGTRAYIISALTPQTHNAR